jgi:nitrogenase iron protein NifH
VRGIAFYGKGGIGKSTTLSNVIAALSSKGQKILQIGCDPKHDSTRLLLGGFTQTTVLEQLNTTGAVSLDSVMLTGYNGAKCIESGGPEPGVGCAGRGIIQTLQLLKDQGLDTSQFDYVFFDVLGDVVCGGFAVPMREGYADEVYIVSSGEIASLYAANNIAKGLKRFASSHGKLGGLIGNERGTKNEREVLQAFAKRIGTELVAFIPRSELVSKAELSSKTIMEFAPGTDLANVYLTIADYIGRHQNPVMPKPLSDAELEAFFHEFCYDSDLKIKTAPSPLQASASNQPQQAAVQNKREHTIDQSDGRGAQVSVVKDREPVNSCSLSGAFNVISQIKDAVALMYSPQGCSYLSFCSHLHQNSLPGSESPYLPNLLCTNMCETDVIFGGAKNLEGTLTYMQKRFPSRPIFLITSCPAGLIGDDVDSIIAKLSTDKQKIFHVTSEGVIGGDFYSGLLNAYELVAEEFIDAAVGPEDDTVNLIGEQNLATTTNLNFKTISQILHALGIKINCRFIRQTSLTEVKNFKKAKVNIPATNEPTIHALTDFLNAYFNTETLKAPLPVAFEQTAEFTRAVARRFGKETAAQKLVAEAKTAYEEELARLTSFFAGKNALIFISLEDNVDWLTSTLTDLHVNATKICFPTLYSPQRRPKSKSRFKADAVPIDKFEEAIQLNRPDFVLTAGPLLKMAGVPCDSFPLSPLYGFTSGLDYAKKLYFKLKIPFIDGWRNDEKLF